MLPEPDGVVTIPHEGQGELLVGDALVSRVREELESLEVRDELQVLVVLPDRSEDGCGPSGLWAVARISETREGGTIRRSMRMPSISATFPQSAAQAAVARRSGRGERRGVASASIRRGNGSPRWLRPQPLDRVGDLPAERPE